MKKTNKLKNALKTLCVALLVFGAHITKSQCQASFTNSTCVNGGPVHFFNTSTGTNSFTSYYWQFGNGATSTQQNPSYTYTANGVYNVCMRIITYTPTFCADSTCKTVTITCVNNGSCQANFSYSNCANGGPMYFWNTSQGTNSLTTYNWKFGNGSSSTQQNPAYTYTANGVYNVCLKIINGNCADSICKTVTVSCVNSGTCNAAFTHSGCVNGKVDFYNTSTGLTSQTKYNWTFGDGGTAWIKNPSHTYNSKGLYYVCLTITDSVKNCSDTYCDSIIVNCDSSSLCKANFTYSNCVNGSPIYFFNTSTGTGTNTAYNWNFGDGTFSNSANPSKTYTANGVYNVCLTVTSGNCSNTICKYVTISCVKTGSCQANFTYSMCANNGQMYFWSTSSGTSGNTKYNWNFGDGGTSQSQHPSHTFSANKFYLVCLTISDSTNNCYSTKCDSVNINCVAASVKQYSQENAQVKVYPNPNSGVFNLDVNQIDPNAKSLVINIYNLLGESVYEIKEEINNGNLSKTININHIAGGAYYMRINSGNKVYSVKTIISK